MSAESRKPDLSDPRTWPVVECESTDVFLGSFIHDCTPQSGSDAALDEVRRQLCVVQEMQKQLAARIERAAELFSRFSQPGSGAA